MYVVDRIYTNHTFLSPFLAFSIANVHSLTCPIFFCASLQSDYFVSVQGVRVVLSSHLLYTSELWTHQPGPHRRKVTKDVCLHLPSAVLALIFIARSILPSVSLVDHEVEFCVPTNQLFSTCWA